MILEHRTIGHKTMTVRSQEFQRGVMGKQCTCRIVQFAIVKNKDCQRTKDKRLIDSIN